MSHDSEHSYESLTKNVCESVVHGTTEKFTQCSSKAKYTFSFWTSGM